MKCHQNVNYIVSFLKLVFKAFFFQGLNYGIVTAYFLKEDMEKRYTIP